MTKTFFRPASAGTNAGNRVCPDDVEESVRRFAERPRTKPESGAGAQMGHVGVDGGHRGTHPAQLQRGQNKR